MSLPNPVPSLVISYSYLWESEAQKEQEEGLKDRPCVVVLSVTKDNKQTKIAVVPITRAPPEDADLKIKIPVRTGQRLGFDDEESWIIISEINQFVWPGPDLRPVPGSNPTKFEYGLLPKKLFEQVKIQLIDYYKKGEVRTVKRT